MRTLLVYAFVAFFSLNAYRDWFKSLCRELIIMMAVIEHPDMPKTVMGIQGLNPFNLLLFNVTIAWLINRRHERLKWDLPDALNLLLLIYLCLVVFGVIRAAADMGRLKEYGLKDLISEELINTVKWVIPGLLLFDGCRSKKRLTWGVVSVFAIYFLLAVQVIRWMPLSAVASGAELEARSRKILMNEIGFHRVNLSMMLSGASWAILCLVPLARETRHKLLILAAAGIVVFGQALTAGRMGYVTWGAVGLILGLMRWRRYLFLVPVGAVVVAFVAPGVVDRMFQGFSQTTASGKSVTDQAEVTAGRNLIWPYVIDEIMESPVVGHGRLAMQRIGLDERLSRELDEDFSHPHNAYLQWLLDNGIIGFVLLMPFYILVVYQSARLFLIKGNPWFAAVGGASLALLLALLLASFGSQTFYPREGAVGMWCSMGLMFRVWVERKKAMRHSYARRPAHRPAPAAIRPRGPIPVPPGRGAPSYARQGYGLQ